jgi:hypothetical protein
MRSRAVPRWAQRQGKHRQGAERGSATLNLVAVFPTVLALLLLVVQAGLLAHARNVARAAAAEGLRATRLYGGSATAGQRRAERFLAEAGDGLLVDTRVTAHRRGFDARVQVSGHALSLLPGFRPSVQATAAGPVELFVPHP